MLNKIVFLCVTPLEGFLTPAFQSCVREYYQWLYGQALLKKVEFQCHERIETYGEAEPENGSDLFDQSADNVQFLYIQSSRRELLKKIFENADLVIMGLPGCKKEFDKIFMPIFPWKDQVMFFWDRHICRGEEYIRQICNEYKLREAQLIELERNLHGELKA